MGREVAVVAGARGADNISPAARPAPVRPLFSPEPGQVVYESKYRNYKRLFLAEPERRDEFGRRIPGRTKHLEFVNFQFITSDPAEIKFLELDLKGKPSPYYGLNRDYWRLEDKLKLEAAKSADYLLEQIQKVGTNGLDESARVRLLRALGVEEPAPFVPPPAPKPSTETFLPSDSASATSAQPSTAKPIK